MKKKVVDGFKALVAKWTSSTIWPTPLGQTVGGPNSILLDKPYEQLNLERYPRLPH
jgi:hypothetical protein